MIAMQLQDFLDQRPARQTHRQAGRRLRRGLPPIPSEFGKNLTLGKDVFINIGCRFQDTGGISIGDGHSSGTKAR
jgi:acetyltransferase-like isoleucine patch superfamily enzyme